MSVQQFVSARRHNWAELETALVAHQSGKLRKLTVAEIEHFGLLYRRTSNDLALARRDYADDQVVEYLNSLCARAHVYLQRGSPARLPAFGRFLLTGVPRTFRANYRYFLASLATFVLGIASGWLAYLLRPDLRSQLVPASPFDQMARGNPDVSLPTPFITGPALFLHNIEVSLILFASGATLGVLTVFLLFVNGWPLGTLGAAVHAGGYDYAFWSLLVAHGVLELSITVISGACAFRIADAILRPGQLSRGNSMYQAMQSIIGLVVGVALLLIIAGITEAAISPSSLPSAIKIAWGATLGVLFYGWLILGGRDWKRKKSRFSLDVNATPQAALPLAPRPEIDASMPN